jgi:hypothetical protein
MVGSMAEMEWDPDLYLRVIREEIPCFDEFEDAVAAATAGVEAQAVLELGVGTGETSRRVRLCIRARRGPGSTRASRCSRGRGRSSRTPTWA